MRVGNHLDRLGEADVADRPAVDSMLELLSRQTGADLLLKRQPSDARILHAQHFDRVDAFAHRRQRNRQRIHREPGIDAGAEHGDLRLSRSRVEARSEPAVGAATDTPPPPWWSRWARGV